MSTSPSRSPTVDSPRETRITSQPQPFPYDSIPAGTSLHSIAIDGFPRSQAADVAPTDAVAGETRARAEGRREGQAEASKAFEDQLARERTGVATALVEFRSDRAAYFQKVEAEVVQLALSIARKILHREAQLDPLLLAGMVRVALENIDGATEIRLRVHPQHAAGWREFLIQHMDPGNLPEIIEDCAQPLDRCELQTSMGSTVVGVEVQLKEIEQGLMDLLAARPTGTP